MAEQIKNDEGNQTTQITREKIQGLFMDHWFLQTIDTEEKLVWLGKANLNTIKMFWVQVANSCVYRLNNYQAHPSPNDEENTSKENILRKKEDADKKCAYITKLSKHASNDKPLLATLRSFNWLKEDAEVIVYTGNCGWKKEAHRLDGVPSFIPGKVVKASAHHGTADIETERPFHNIGDGRYLSSAVQWPFVLLPQEIKMFKKHPDFLRFWVENALIDFDDFDIDKYVTELLCISDSNTTIEVTEYLINFIRKKLPGLPLNDMDELAKIGKSNLEMLLTHCQQEIDLLRNGSPTDITIEVKTADPEASNAIDAEIAEIKKFSDFIISNAIPRAEEKPLFVKYRSAEWFHDGQEVILYTREAIHVNVRLIDGVPDFVRCKVTDAKPGYVVVCADCILHRGDLHDGCGARVLVTSPDILLPSDYEYLRTHPGYLAVWADNAKETNRKFKREQFVAAMQTAPIIACKSQTWSKPPQKPEPRNSEPGKPKNSEPTFKN